MSATAPTDRLDGEIRGLLAEVGRLRADPSALAPDDDLFAAGLSSLATVDLMLAIEDRFGIEFPQERLTRRTFATLAAIRETVVALRGDAP